MKNHRVLTLIVALASIATGCSTNTKVESENMTDTDKPAHHLSDGTFQNPPGSPSREAGFGDMVKFLYKQMFDTEAPSIPNDHVLSTEQQTSQLADAGNPSITWLGHAAFIIRSGEKIIITDPYLQETAGPLGFGPKRFIKAPISGSELPKADVMIISHNHYDHLDAKTVDAYPYKDDIQVIVPLGLGKFFSKRGYANVLEQDWWDKWSVDGLKITTLPAVHFSGRGIGDRNKTLWASFGIETTEDKIWFSGDTARGDIFKEIGQRTGPYDVALVAIGAYEPRHIMESVHVTPEEAVDISQAVGAEKAIGMHWGTIMLTPENPFDAPGRFLRAAQEKGFGEENVSVMKIGETRALGN